MAGKSGKFHQCNSGYGTFVESSQAKKMESERFARELVAKLEEACNDHNLNDLILIASPSFHGMLNKCLKNSSVQQMVSVNVEKDYTKMNPQQLLTRLMDYI